LDQNAGQRQEDLHMFLLLPAIRTGHKSTVV